MATKKRLVVGADPFPPYQYIDEDGQIKGSDYEIVKSIIDEMGYEAEFIIKDWPEIERMFNEKKIDIAFQVQKTPEREKKYYFSDKLRDAVTVVITSKDREIECKNLEDLIDKIVKNNWKLGVMAGYRYGDPIDSLPDKYKAIFRSTDELLDAVNSKKVDFGVMDLGVLNWYIAKKGYRNIKVVENARFARPLYVIFNDPKLRDEFNKYLRKHVQSHT